MSSRTLPSRATPRHATPSQAGPTLPIEATPVPADPTRPQPSRAGAGLRGGSWPRPRGSSASCPAGVGRCCRVCCRRRLPPGRPGKELLPGPLERCWGGGGSGARAVGAGRQRLRRKRSSVFVKVQPGLRERAGGWASCFGRVEKRLAPLFGP